MSAFWLENLGALFGSTQLVPHTQMSLAEQLNCVTRLLLICCVIMWLFNFNYGLYFLLISLAFIIIIYYIQRNTMRRCNEEPAKTRENYQNLPQRVSVVNYTPSSIVNRSSSIVKDTRTDSFVINSGEPLPFCNDEMSLENLGVEPHKTIAVGMNQRLAKGQSDLSAHPATFIPPVVIPPAYDLESWKDNNLIVFSAINSPGAQQEMYLSGYAESSCCGYMGQGTQLVPQIQENYRGIVAPQPVDERPYVPVQQVRENYRGIVAPQPVDERPYVPVQQVREGYSDDLIIEPDAPGMVNTVCGYNPQQTRVGLPSNYPASSCQQDPSMKRYNENLFTQTVTPGTYTRNQVNEPINSNIGISFTQQFEPVTCKRDEKGLQYLLHDPRIIEPDVEKPAPKVIPKANYDNVYDPRFYGYGTSYRSYLEPVTGQTRFLYDDVNAIRMPTYITRSKIDFLPYADTYGPMEPGAEFGNAHNAEIRALAQDSWLRNSMQFREDLTERRMRKINSEAWQKRMYPNSRRPVGSNSVLK